MAWSGVITDAGQALIDTWMSGSHTLTIDGASIGSGTVATADMHSSTALVSEKDDAAIVRTETVTNGVKIRLQFGATELASGYTAKEIGIWARLDGGSKTLLSLHQDSGDGIAIPKKSSFPDFAFVIACVLNTSNTENLTVTVDTTACATIGDLEDAVDSLGSDIDDLRSSIMVLEFTKFMEANLTAYFDEDITAYAADADDYMIIGASVFMPKVASDHTAKFPQQLNMWQPMFIMQIESSGGTLMYIDPYPMPELYNEDSKCMLRFTLLNSSNKNANVKFRIVLMKVGTIANA